MLPETGVDAPLPVVEDQEKVLYVFTGLDAVLALASEIEVPRQITVGVEAAETGSGVDTVTVTGVRGLSQPFVPPSET